MPSSSWSTPSSSTPSSLTSSSSTSSSSPALSPPTPSTALQPSQSQTSKPPLPKVQPQSEHSPIPRTAPKCGHTLHPSTTHNSRLCPPCKTQKRIKRLSIALDFLHDYPKPDPFGEIYCRDERHSMARATYYAERVAFQGHIAELEALAETERTWDVEHVDALKGMGSTSSREALEMVRAARVLGGGREVGEEIHVNGKRSLTKKSVRFSTDVREGALRHEHCFRRSHWRYVKGRWGAPEGRAWVNTSFFKEVRYGVEEFENELEAEWHECLSPDAVMYLGEIEEEGRLVLAWLDEEVRRRRSKSLGAAPEGDGVRKSGALASKTDGMCENLKFG